MENPKLIPAVRRKREAGGKDQDAHGTAADSPIARARKAVIRMRRRPRRVRRLTVGGRTLLVDASMLALAAVADAIAADIADLPSQPAGWAVLPALLTLLAMASRGMYRSQIAPSYMEDVPRIIAATAVAAMATTFLRVLFTDDPDAAQQAVRAWGFSATYLAAARGGVRLAVGRAALRAPAGAPTLIVGAGEVGHLVARRLLDNPSVGLDPVGFVDDDPRAVEEGAQISVLGAISDLEELVARHRVEQAILSFSRASHRQELDVTRRLLRMGVSVSIVPRLFEGVPDRIALSRAAGLPLVTIYPSDPSGWQFDVKYVLDRILALALTLLLGPILVSLAIAVWVDLGRPVLFRQRRVGLDGKEFELFKFRTMREPDDDADRSEQPAATDLDLAPGGVEGEDRRSRFGGFLRRTSLDELPQLLNVLKGDMSLVGPRPERVGFVRLYAPSVYRYADRHRAKSGITGWAQVHGLRGKTSLAARVEWDNYYIENWSLWLDLRIMLLTVPAMLRDRSE